MSNDLSTRRLRKELASLMKSPVENIEAMPLESNILEWHYVITGTKGTPYEGGYYHGKLKFPPAYPLKPPSVLMLTPSGRFKPNRRLCLSMSDFHPESWNPMWSVATILTGLYSFMLDSAPTLGSVEASTAQRQKYAAQSLEFNCKNQTFCELFPHYVEKYEEQKAARAAAGGVAGTGAANARETGSAAHPAGVVGGAGGQAARGGGMAALAGQQQVAKEQEPGFGLIVASIAVSIGLLMVLLRST
mmetsp:Transcript_5593/g.9490  ORF Transcript_5593/g.9490 Transcript_5593/m.9490 type:complete len:246 (+) Transcript_5593:198-935(+)